MYVLCNVYCIEQQCNGQKTEEEEVEEGNGMFDKRKERIKRKPNEINESCGFFREYFCTWMVFI